MSKKGTLQLNGTVEAINVDELIQNAIDNPGQLDHAEWNTLRVTRRVRNDIKSSLLNHKAFEPHPSAANDFDMVVEAIADLMVTVMLHVAEDVAEHKPVDDQE